MWYCICSAILHRLRITVSLIILMMYVFLPTAFAMKQYLFYHVYIAVNMALMKTSFVCSMTIYIRITDVLNPLCGRLICRVDIDICLYVLVHLYLTDAYIIVFR